MSRTRLFLPQTKPSRGRSPTTIEGWKTLLDQAVTRATERSDRRLQGLLRARQDGTAEKILRTFGIISEACLDREFPEPTPKT